ncbi:MAG: AarF/UbiB family protein, partial [Actinobacteria bacterium]|nr:AarF/UbiB family protein [Actinomycetota bacterium]
IEAVHAKRFAAMFAGNDTVKVAKIYSKYSSKNVLTMELIKGIKLDDEKSLQKANIDKKVLAKHSVDALLQQVFVQGFFHADPHPGNYFALQNNVFAFVDYGMAGRLTELDRREFAAFFISFMNQDSESAIKHLLHLVEVGGNANKMSFEHDVDDILHDWFGAKLKEVSLARTFMRILDSGRRNRIYFPSSFAYLGKSLLTTEAMGMSLDPDFDFALQMKPYAMQILKAEVSLKSLKQKLEASALDYYSYLEQGPEVIMQVLKKIQNGQLEVKINREEFEEFGKRLSEEGTKRLITTLIVTLFAVGIISYLVANNFLNFHLSLSTLAVVFLVLFGGWIMVKKLFSL